MANGNSELTQEVLAELRRTNYLLTALLKLQLAPFIESELQDKTRKAIYELTGQKSVRELPLKLTCRWGRFHKLGHAGNN